MLLTRLSLALDSPFARLRVTSEETVDFGGKGDGDDTLWVATDPTSSVTGLTHASKGKGGSSYALIATREGLAVRRRSSNELAGGETETETETVANSDSAWRVTAVSRGGLGDGCWRADGVGAGGDGGGGVGASSDGDSVSGAATTPPPPPPPPPTTTTTILPPTRPAQPLPAERSPAQPLPAQPLPAQPLPAQPLPAQRLQPSQLAAFVRDGCLVLRSLVPATVLFRAQTAVNSRLGRPGGLSLFYDEARKVVPHFYP